MVRGVRQWAAALCAAWLGSVALPALAGNGLILSTTSGGTAYSGTTFSMSFGLQLENFSVPVRHAPFTVRTTLPAGMTLAGFFGGWACSQVSGHPDQIRCTYNTDLTTANWQASYAQIDVAVAANVTPGPVAVVFTVESAEIPLDPNAPCPASSSNTGCMTLATSYVHSTLAVNDWGYSNGTVTNGPDATWTAAPFEAGTQTYVEVGIMNRGYGPQNSPVTLDVFLPAGLSFNHALGSLPAYTCAASTVGAFQRVRCTTPYMIDQQYGYAALAVDVAANVPTPGPLVLYAALSNNVQAAPDCIAQPVQTGCGRLTVPTQPARVPAMRLVSATHSPTTFVIGQDAGPIVLDFRNGGAGNATTTALYVHLPPGFTYLQTLASLPGLSCSASGTAQAGQTLTCTGAGLPAGSSGYASFTVHVDDAAQAPGPVPVLAAIDTASPPNALNALNSCTSNPSQPMCAWHDVPTFYPCARQFGPDAIYCDNFQVHVH